MLAIDDNDDEPTAVTAAEIGGADYQASALDNLAAYAQFRAERAERRRAQAEAENWRAEALSLRRHMGIPTGGAYARYPAPQTSEPERDSAENQNETKEKE